MPFELELALRRPPLCAELRLWLASDGLDLEKECASLSDAESPPYWAFCWGSGQALARFILDHPAEVRGRRVVDLGSGSGVVALSAARAGASGVYAVDVDPEARRAAQANADANALKLESVEHLPHDAAWDVLLAADVLYEPQLATHVHEAARRGHPVLLADPERTGVSRLELEPIARIEARTFPDVDPPHRSNAIFKLHA